MAERFERTVASRIGRERGVACSSGTAGLHMLLVAMGVGPGDEVITTSLSFIAPANAILYVGAKPVLVDVCPKSLNADPRKVEAAITDRTKAIIAVENFGNPEYMDEYRRIADRHEVKLIEDACEGLGGALRAKPIGSFGHAAVFGFYPNKQITTGEGGMVVTDDGALADLLLSLRNQGRPAGSMTRSATGGGAVGTGRGERDEGRSSGTGMGPSQVVSWMDFARLGFNYRLSEINAALGVAQMERLDEIVRRRREVADRYIERLLDHPDLAMPSVAADSTMSWFVFVVRLDEKYTREERDRIVTGMHRHDVGCAAYFPCVHLQPHFRALGYAEGDFPIAERVSDRTIALPFFTELSARDADFAARTLELMIERENLRKRA
jgi:perosamine synthetase